MTNTRLKIVALAAALAAIATQALAQVPSWTPPTLQRATFSAAFSGLAVPQTGAGDAVCLVGSATKTVFVTRVSVSATNATAQTSLMNLVKRTAANTGGTSTAATVGKMDSASGAATATLNGYTAVPTSGAGVNLISSYVAMSAATVGAGVSPQVFLFNPQENLAQPVVLRGVAQSLCVQFPAAFTTNGPALSASFTWTEQ